MPDRITIKAIIDDALRNVRIPGIDKPFEEITIGELTQLKPGELETHIVFDISILPPVSVHLSPPPPPPPPPPPK